MEGSMLFAYSKVSDGGPGAWYVWHCPYIQVALTFEVPPHIGMCSASPGGKMESPVENVGRLFRSDVALSDSSTFFFFALSSSRIFWQFRLICPRLKAAM
jgi:hypothetical protein